MYQSMVGRTTSWRFRRLENGARRRFLHHLLADQRDRRAAIAQEAVVEALPGRAAAAAADPVLAQPADHQFAHRVVEIGGIVGAARRLLAGIALVLEALLAE